MKKAFHIARSGRPGPVVVDIPKDVSFNKTGWNGYTEKLEMRSYNPVRKGHSGQIRKALQLLLAAKRPYIYPAAGAGQRQRGTAHAGQPARLSLHQHPHGSGRDLRHRSQVPRHAGHARHDRGQQRDAELRRAAGRGRALRRPRDRQPKHFASSDRKIIHIDVDPSSISKRVKVDIPIVGDVKEVLAELIAQIRETGSGRTLPPWAAGGRPSRAGARRTACATTATTAKVIKPQHVIETLWNMTKDVETYVTSDVGQHQMWAAQFYKFPEPRRWINSGGLGTMGVGIPTPWASSWPSRTGGVLRDRRRFGADVHPGTLHLPAVQHADQDPGAEQPLPGHGAPVAGTRLRGPLQPQLHGCAAQLREARRGLRPRGHADRAAGGRGAGCCARRAS